VPDGSSIPLQFDPKTTIGEIKEHLSSKLNGNKFPEAFFDIF